MMMRAAMRLAMLAMVVAMMAAMSGCGSGLAPVSVAGSAAPVVLTKVTGRVHGGQQPVSGAAIQLYAAGNTGLQSASTALISKSVLTDAYGNFTITGDWDCTSNEAVYGVNPELYIVATGGNPGLSAGTNNAALAMMAALGPCSSVTATTSIYIDEVTTVASVVALTPFMTDAGHVGSSASGAVGLANAFATANVLANMSTGRSPGAAVAANVTVPIAEVNSLADMLAACVNSDGTQTGCSRLFAASTADGGAAPADTIAAMLNINMHPGSHVADLQELVTPDGPFQVALTAAPNDWTVALNFTGGGLSAPAGLALDANGNAWVANGGGNSVTEMSSTGSLLSGSAGYSGNNAIFGAQGIAVDRDGNVWVADTLLSTVVKLSVSGGAVQSSTSYSGGGISGPTAVAIDSQNNVWVANFAGRSVTELNRAGAVIGGSPLTANGQLGEPLAVAVDGNGNAWVTDNAAGKVLEFSSAGALLSGGGYTDGAMLAPGGIAIDAKGRAWVAESGTSALSLLATDGSPMAPAPLAGGWFSMPVAVAVDGQGTAWVANNQRVGSVSAIAAGAAGPLSPGTGFGTVNAPSSVAVDGSGSVWTANSGDNSVSEFIGIAVPAVVPLASQTGP